MCTGQGWSANMQRCRHAPARVQDVGIGERSAEQLCYKTEVLELAKNQATKSTIHNHA